MKKGKTTNSSGITLIALVVTIIVLLILAGISISMLSGDNGILQRTITAKENTANEQIKEKIKLAYHSALTGGKGSYTKESLENELEAEFGENNYNVDDSDNDNWILTAKVQGKEQSVTIPAGKIKSNIEYDVYTIGEEVTVGNENFYVLENSGSEKDTVTLLAKYNLNLDGTAQAPNTSYTNTKCIFSSEYYWAEAYESYSDWANKKLDINAINGNIVGDAISKAQNYAISKGGTNGRLLTKEETENLSESYGNMIWGKANQSENYLFYWLASAAEPNNSGVDRVWFVYGQYEGYGHMAFNETFFARSTSSFNYFEI